MDTEYIEDPYRYTRKALTDVTEMHEAAQSLLAGCGKSDGSTKLGGLWGAEWSQEGQPKQGSRHRTWALGTHDWPQRRDPL